ncbi:hypothetical protein ACQP1K_07810 [Sphaerimonospora sp. CA-214678]|uniref:hypothetical protein n=1 Tax=Sphaerimonospora sp. CA-214678 TaxID=3240029 RepID=UPI003D8EB5CE
MRLRGSIVEISGVLERVPAFIFGGTEVAVGGVATSWIVEPFDMAEDGRFGF